MFKQSDAIRDYIFPIASAEMRGNDMAVKRVLGTAFLIGSQGFALTANHVIAGSQDEKLIAIFALQSGGWFGYVITARESYPSEDVALVKLDGAPWKSFFRLSNSVEHASCKYRLFGYPDDATFELVVGNQAVSRPDLVYNEGYIRRRYTGELPAIKGTSFFELSEVAGTGASGAPICKVTDPVWELIGIYVGEKINDRATSVSYAVREETFRGWVPEILGKSVLEESQCVTV
jgi:Trypsin-like peptidase domain